MTPAEWKVIRTAIDAAEAGHNIGFDQLPSVMIHEIYEAVEELKRETKMDERGQGPSRRYEEDPHKSSELRGVPGETVVAQGGTMSTEERVRRFKFAIAEYARFNRELLRQQTELDEASINVDRLKTNVASARLHVLQLIGNTANVDLDFLEALHWRYVEHGWDATDSSGPCR